MRLATWGAPAVLVAGLAALAAVFSQTLPDRGPFELGLIYPILRYEELLALAGIGFAMAQMPGRLLLANAALFVAAIPLGGVVASSINAALAAGANVFAFALLIAPAACVTAGLALASPQLLRTWLLPPATLTSGIALGLVINFDDPMIQEWAFAGGTIVSGLWLVAAPLLIWRRYERPWFRIAARILGSWLIAIGAMLGALALIPH